MYYDITYNKKITISLEKSMIRERILDISVKIGGTEVDIKRRLSVARASFASLYKIWKSKKKTALAPNCGFHICVTL